MCDRKGMGDTTHASSSLVAFLDTVLATGRGQGRREELREMSEKGVKQNNIIDMPGVTLYALHIIIVR
jgi:hypothetical protein